MMGVWETSFPWDNLGDFPHTSQCFPPSRLGRPGCRRNTPLGFSCGLSEISQLFRASGLSPATDSHRPVVSVVTALSG